MGQKKSRFIAGPTNTNAKFTMAFVCAECQEPGIAHSDDQHGMYVGTCSGGHQVTVMAS